MFGRKKNITRYSRIKVNKKSTDIFYTINKCICAWEFKKNKLTFEEGDLCAFLVEDIECADAFVKKFVIFNDRKEDLEWRKS